MWECSRLFSSCKDSLKAVFGIIAIFGMIWSSVMTLRTTVVAMDDGNTHETTTAHASKNLRASM
jgi:hypothetical protein